MDDECKQFSANPFQSYVVATLVQLDKGISVVEI